MTIAITEVDQTTQKVNQERFPVTKGGQEITFWAKVVSFFVNLFKKFSKEKDKTSKANNESYTNTL